MSVRQTKVAKATSRNGKAHRHANNGEQTGGATKLAAAKP